MKIVSPHIAKPVATLARYALVMTAAVLLGIGALEVVSRAFAAVFHPPQMLSQAERHDRISRSVAQMLEQRSEAIVVFDRHLGWRPQANLDNGIDQINAQRLRATRTYSKVPEVGVRRIAAFGDSFVYGTEVATDAAWPAVLERLMPDTEVLNYGVPGYGPDQAYLRFESAGAELSPDVVVLGLATPSLVRILTVSPAFQSTEPYFVAKPRFVLAESGDRLELVPNPLSTLQHAREFLEDPRSINRLGGYDYWYEPLIQESPLYDGSYAFRLIAHGWSKLSTRYLDPDRPLIGPPGGGVFNQDSSSFRILTLLIERFYQRARELGVVPVVALLPDGYSVGASRDGKSAIMAPVYDYCLSREIAVVDLTEAFLAEPASVALDEWFFHGFHYTEAGNRIVAAWLASYLEDVAEDPAERAPNSGLATSTRG